MGNLGIISHIFITSPTLAIIFIKIKLIMGSTVTMVKSMTVIMTLVTTTHALEIATMMTMI